MNMGKMQMQGWIVSLGAAQVPGNPPKHLGPVFHAHLAPCPSQLGTLFSCALMIRLPTTPVNEASASGRVDDDIASGEIAVYDAADEVKASKSRQKPHSAVHSKI